MTSDAKIGLLLGLVFIFVIAFIINGLPNLKPQTTRAEVSTNMVSLADQNIGVADVAQTRADQDWRGLVNEREPEVEAVEPSAEPSASIVEIPSQQNQTVNNQGIRFESPLPRIENLLERISAGLQSQREQTSTVNMNVPASASMEQPAVTERQPVVQVPQFRPQETATRSAEQPKPAAGTPAKPPERTYVVGEGESLSAVAKKVYGPEEGNRIVNVNRIYEANKDVLKSVHEVVAGQKLVIPPLPQPTVNPNKPSDVLSKELFEKVNAIGKRASAQMPASSVESRWYTVQDGDNLWRIASSQLGTGARYDEIAKLNADILKDPSKVDPGTKIRLPLK